MKINNCEFKKTHLLNWNSVKKSLDFCEYGDNMKKDKKVKNKADYYK